VSRIDDASVYQSVELVNTTVKCQRVDRIDERASTSASIAKTSDERRVANARHHDHDVYDSSSDQSRNFAIETLRSSV
jgi:hypothetical protein